VFSLQTRLIGITSVPFGFLWFFFWQTWFGWLAFVEDLWHTRPTGICL